MSKILSKISSALLAVVLTVALSAAATAQTTVVRKGGKATAFSQVAKERSSKPSRVHVAKARSTQQLQTPSLQKAMKAAHVANKVQAPHQAAAAFPDLYGLCIYMNTWIDADDMGLFNIAADGALDKKFPVSLNTYAKMWCGIGIDGIYYLPTYIDYGIYAWFEMNAFDIETGELVGNSENAEPFNIAFGFAQDPTDGTVYGIGYNEDATAYMLAKHDFVVEEGEAFAEVTPISPIEGSWNTLVCDNSGQLYGISYETDGEGTCTSSTLCKIDKLTGAVTEVGETGQLPQYISSAVIDPKTNVMYWTVCPPDDSGILCTVDLTTGAATKVADLEGQAELIGLYVAPPLAADDAPAAPTALNAEFADGGLTGTVSFTAPTTLFDGTPATGALTYSILAGGEEVATGSTTFGAEVSAEVTLEANGEYTFQATVSNAAGKSPAAKLTTYVGYGVPKAPTVTLTAEGTKMMLSWTAVTATVDGGYINPAAVTYTVTRMPGEVVVAEKTTATTFEETLAEPESIVRYYYTVVAHSDNLSSAPAKSGDVVLGSIVPPYSNNFEGTNPLDGYTVIDANGDGRTWSVASGQVRVSFNTSMAMDDWLITPPLHLEAGKAYYVSVDAKAAGKSYPERLEIKWGNAATIDAMTKTVLAPTDITDTEFHEFGDYIIPETTGVYYVGLHGISDKNQYYLWIDNLAVSGAMSGAAPATPGDIVVTPDANGLFKTEITFKAPSTSFSGSTLDENLTKVEVKRGSEVIKTFTDVAPGTTLILTDELQAAGNVTYSFQAFNEAGSSKVATVTVFVGVDTPSKPQNIVLTETATPGQVTVTWDEITTDYKGGTINPALVTYDVCVKVGSDWVALNEERLTETNFTFQAVPEGDQNFIQVGVFAYTSGGKNSGVSNMIAAGTPYPFMEESFAEGKVSGDYILGIDVSDDYGVEWGLYTDASGIDSQDADNGFLGLVGDYLNDYGMFWTGKIDLAGKVNPGILFYTYYMPLLDSNDQPAPDLNELQLYAKKASDADWTALGEPFVISELGEPDTWVPVSASLADYAGQVVQVRVKATVKAAKITLFDNIKVGDLLDQDLAALGVSALPAALVGSDYDVTVKVGNLGLEDATAFTIKLFADDEEVATKEVESLAAGKVHAATFTFTMDPLATEPVKYYAQVVYTADENTDNNTSATTEVAPQASKLPAVADLSGKDGAEGVELTWSEPDMNAMPTEPETVDFEDGESWAQTYEGWTFVDVDQSPVGQVFNGWDIPGITPAVTAAGFFLFDDTEVTNPLFASHSGHKTIASNYRDDYGQVDDWAISPVLSGAAQTITFWAKSARAMYAEAIEMYYSEGSLDPADFIKVGETVNAVPGDWTMYSFDVPAGAKHFAVRSCATDALMLLLDDFTFISGTPVGAGLSLVGYDVYRDGEKITAAPVAETEYVDTAAEDGSHTYVVVTVYDKGISAPSNAVTVVATGIAEITFDPNDTSEYYNLQGIRVLNPEKGVLYLRKQLDGTASKVRF